MTHVPEYGQAPGPKPWRRFVRRWLLRIGIVVAVLAVIVPVSVITWGWWENHQLNKELAALRAAGEPTAVSDLDSPPVSDAENCITDLEAAAKIVEKHESEFKAVDDLNGYDVSVGLPLRGDEHAAIRTAVDASAEAFPLVE